MFWYCATVVKSWQESTDNISCYISFIWFSYIISRQTQIGSITHLVDSGEFHMMMEKFFCILVHLLLRF